MATNAYPGGNTLKLGDGAGTEVFTDVGEVQSVSGVGETNQEIRVTHWTSTAHEYIAGIAEGSEVTVVCNSLLAHTEQDQAIVDIVAGKAARNWQYVTTDGTTTRTGDFAATMLGYQYLPSSGEQTEQNQIQFTFRITAGITWVDV